MRRMPSVIWIGTLAIAGLLLPKMDAQQEQPGVATTDVRARGLTAQSANGVLNASQFPGADIGARVNAAFAACPQKLCTVFVPAGDYSFSTTIVLPAVTAPTLDMDQQAYLHYTGTGVALSTSQQTGSVVIRGGHVIGNPTAKVGILLLQQTQGIYVTGTDVNHFSNGDGLLDLGANVVKLTNIQLRFNLFGLHLMGAPGYASNSVSVSGSVLTQNRRWGIVDGDVTQFPANWMGTGGGTGVSSPELGNAFINNDLEENGTDDSGKYGAVLEGLTYKSVYTGNYFEASPHQVQIGCLNGNDPVYRKLYGIAGPNCGTAVSTTIRDNYFTAGAPVEIELYAAIDAIIDGNAELGHHTSCFADITGESINASIASNHIDGWSTANNHQGEWMVCHGSVNAPGKGWENVNAIPVDLSVGGTSVYFNGKSPAGGAAGQQMIRYTSDGPKPGFCTPAWSPGAIWMNTTTGQMWVCQADSIAPHGGAQGKSADGQASWVVK